MSEGNNFTMIAPFFHDTLSGFFNARFLYVERLIHPVFCENTLKKNISGDL